MNNPRVTIETYAKIEPTTWHLATYVGNLRFWALARAYHHLGDYEQELATVIRALEYRPNSMKRLRDKLRALAALGRIQDIYSVIDECVTVPDGFLNPSDVMCAADRNRILTWDVMIKVGAGQFDFVSLQLTKSSKAG